MKAVSALLRRCAEAIHEADGLFVTAGAGMGTDSGLPDFRGTQRFWRAYPSLGRARIAFESMASSTRTPKSVAGIKAGWRRGGSGAR